ncbi:hypothetical protein [Mycoplasmopsis iners]|uniref:hypothetical protein n=1 Tax=Mycoplasmopsis iners TaxID=76630 RepID=UPI000496F8D4|nr:hypothetical protein [Mycoplasmopsis iners]
MQKEKENNKNNQAYSFETLLASLLKVKPELKKAWEKFGKIDDLSSFIDKYGFAFDDDFGKLFNLKTPDLIGNKQIIDILSKYEELDKQSQKNKQNPFSKLTFSSQELDFLLDQINNNELNDSSILSDETVFDKTQEDNLDQTTIIKIQDFVDIDN